MASETGISWATSTFNPWLGCEKISPACDHCHAETWAVRYRRGDGLWRGNRVRTSEANWRQPMLWDRKAKVAGQPWRVFCASLADVFDNQVDPQWRADLFELIGDTPHLTWMLLTKRPQNIMKMLPREWAENGEAWPNVWLGTTVENQTEAKRRLHHLAAAPARVRFVSCEPLLGPLNDLGLGRVGGPNWVICGGESGSCFRWMDPDWARAIRDDCRAAGVPFFYKQTGGASQRHMLPIPDDLMIREFPVV